MVCDKREQGSSIYWINASFLAIAWGIAWAYCLQFTQWGRWLAFKRTWITVVIGVGVDLIILLLVLPVRHVMRVLYIVALSSLGIIARSLHNELREDA